MPEQIPSLGRIVHYRLTANDAQQIKRARLAGGGGFGPTFRGNEVAENDVFPMTITRVWGNTPDTAVNGQVMLDGNDLHWATSVHVGEGAGTFSWPTRT